MITGNFKTREVLINGVELSPAPSQKLRNHSPDGFMWGYGGSGPAQLALALMLHFLTPAGATKIYQEFKWRVVATLPKSDFSIDEDTIVDWLKLNATELGITPEMFLSKK